MEYKKINAYQYILTLDNNELLIKTLTSFINNKKIGMVQLQLIGGVNDITLGYMRTKDNAYLWKTFKGQWELIGASGTIAWNKYTNQPVVHCHVSIIGEDYHAFGGHLYEATVATNLEVVMTIISDEAIYYKGDKQGQWSKWDI